MKLLQNNWIKIIFSVFFVFLICVSVVPLSVTAESPAKKTGIVPDCDGSITRGTGEGGKPACGYDSFIDLINSLIDYLTKIGFFISILSFSYVGYLLLTSGGDEKKATEAKETATQVAIGFIIMLTGWLIVYSITHVFLANDLSIFKK